MATIYTGLLLIAVPPGKGQRHVTPDRQRTLCDEPVPGEWYTGDAGQFGKKGDCPKCLAILEDYGC